MSYSKQLDNFNCAFGKQNASDYQNVSIESFSISIGKKPLFIDSKLKLSYGSKYGFIGKNGCGKSTLLKHIANKILPVDQNMDILYVDQEIEANDKSAFQTVIEANVLRTDLMNQSDLIMKQLDDDSVSDKKKDKLIKELTEIETNFSSLNFDKDESVVRKILKGLGFSESDQEKPTKDFSGGWRMRISLARALYLEPTLLLLDEPTNHLDLNAVIWLNWYLSTWKKILLVVSHDQGFLNDVCDNIINIEDNKLEYYRGDFGKFKAAFQQKKNNKLKEWEKLEKTVKQMRKKSKPKKEVNDFIAKREKEGVVKPEKDYVVKIMFEDVLEIGRPILEIKDVGFEYNSEKKIFDCVNFGLDMDTRVTLVGKNGAGKSTLIKLITGELEPTKGEVFRKNQLRIGYYHQHFDSYLPKDKTPIEYIESVSKVPEEELENTTLYQYIRRQLGSISLEGEAHTKLIGELSGGQKARIAFVALILQRPHLLLMDEPTNHLDIESVNGLIEGINNFNGGVFVITHDSELVTRTDCDLWIVEDNKLIFHKGDYEDYKDKIIDELDD